MTIRIHGFKHSIHDDGRHNVEGFPHFSRMGHLLLGRNRNPCQQGVDTYRSHDGIIFKTSGDEFHLIADSPYPTGESNQKLIELLDWLLMHDIAFDFLIELQHNSAVYRFTIPSTSKDFTLGVFNRGVETQVYPGETS